MRKSGWAWQCWKKNLANKKERKENRTKNYRTNYIEKSGRTNSLQKIKIMMNNDVTTYIENAPADLRAIMEALRSFIHENVDEVEELFKWSRPVFHSSSDFAYIQVNKKHVNLGFFNGSELLEDPQKTLQGTGKAMRHIKLKSTADIDEVLLHKWLITLTNI